MHFLGVATFGLVSGLPQNGTNVLAKFLPHCRVRGMRQGAEDGALEDFLPTSRSRLGGSCRLWRAISRTARTSDQMALAVSFMVRQLPTCERAGWPRRVENRAARHQGRGQWLAATVREDAGEYAVRSSCGGD